MQWLELHNVEYGECIVLGGAHHDILMVDCGSINPVSYTHLDVYKRQ